MDKKTYSQKLQDPRWQKKRLEIMQRDNFTCQACGDTESELHVHHKQYTTDLPQNELSENLITYCCVCHDVIHYTKNHIIDIDNDYFMHNIVVKNFKSSVGVFSIIYSNSYVHLIARFFNHVPEYSIIGFTNIYTQELIDFLQSQINKK